MAVSQLVQDKLCRVDFDQSSEFCISINSADHMSDAIKSKIITNNTYIILYRTLLTTFPCIVWAFFLGPWSDNHVNARKYIMIVGASAAILESIILFINALFFNFSAYYVLLSFIPSALSGGIVTILMAIYSYCAATSDNCSRSIRFAIVEIFLLIAYSTGSFVGGQILGNGDSNSLYQLYNYKPIFVVSFFMNILALIWAILFIDESPYILTNEIIQTGPDLINSSVLFIDNSSINNDEVEANSYNNPSTMNNNFTSFNVISRQFWKQFQSIFDFNHVIKLWRTLSQKRDNWDRGQIWILLICTACLLLVYLNTAFVLWLYVEQLFGWTPKFYSNIISSVAILTLILMGILLPVFVNILHFEDLQLSLLGILSLISQCLLRGSWQQEAGTYLSFFTGTLAPLSLIGIRSRLSKIIQNDERGKLFALLAIVEATIPTIAGLFYSIIFALSLDIYPGLVFQIAASILFIPLLSILFIDMYCTHNYDE